MTVVYTHTVATGSQSFGNFRRLLWLWGGSIYKLVLPDLVVYMILYYAINIPYRLVISARPPEDDGKRYFHRFTKYAREAAGLIPLQFVLGFYVSQILTRWWSMFMAIPWPDTIAVTVASGVHGNDDRGRLMRRTILRYMVCSLAMVFTMISPQARSRFPSLDDMVTGGLLVPHERLILDHLNEKTPGPKYYVPVVWAGVVAVKARKEGRILDDMALYSMIKEICKFRNMLNDLLSYDWVNIPIVYTQVATLCTYVYFLSCLMAKQLINDPEEVDIYVPVFLFLEFIFMTGWLKVAETCINPFGLDEDDFEVNWLVDRNMTVSFMIVDEMHDEFPEMLKDAFWEGVIPDELMYTPEALKYKTEGMGGGSAAIGEEDTISKKDATRPPSKANVSVAQFNVKRDEEMGPAEKRSDVRQYMERKTSEQYNEDSYENIQEAPILRKFLFK